MELKQKPEDFIVEEIIDLDRRAGAYIYVKLVKRNLNTIDVINQISKILNIPRIQIGFAGNKDKVAITTQYISLNNIKKEQIQAIHIPDVKLTPLHSGSKPIFLGQLLGNNFRVKSNIRIRGLRIDSMVNYYGQQRFSSNNKDVGKAILLKNYKEACRLINDQRINNFLKNTNNAEKALKLLDKRLLSLYVNAYQSYLWNEVAKTFIRENYRKYINYDNLLFVERPKSNMQIPLISYDTVFKNPYIKRIYFNLMKKESIKTSDYEESIFPKLISKTGYRPLFVKVRNFHASGDFIEFFLPKGSYATIFMKYLEALTKKSK